ncbi:hypothetical protein CONLIGDRAFT_629783 [Coniochaeta ligniaria NRRL 30616]|uniref:DUF202 domain-containing protein n=1 Tax=Coniochaeta ligniaria NRRL 30616 TaxID=1408157 RepID=A0A1J7JRU7_9PEZI|nr:hypothetical protein CONLIGDRAFT_629783 [Coniochaeta ligniaria NRRL 30616]
MTEVEQQQIVDEEDGTISCCTALPVMSDLTRPVHIGGHRGRDTDAHSAFWLWPIFGPLLFENETSDARDHCANERTFLSYLRLSVYMAVVSVAIVLSFHLKTKASDIELRMAKPLGAIFWALSVACLLVGCANYIRTVNRYSTRAALVQTGWKTQSIIGAIALSIVGACFTLLVINRLGSADVS